MYYNNGQEQELGFDAFIAPDDFNRTAQPVDIYEVFKREYALNSQARYIYYYSDGNYPLTLTPTASQYYRYGYTQGGTEVIVDVPLNGTAVTIFGETTSTKRWVLVYRPSTANFSVVLSSIQAQPNYIAWLYCGSKVQEVRRYTPRVDYSGVYKLKYIHLSNINQLNINLNENFFSDGSSLLTGRCVLPETITSIGADTFGGCNSITKFNFPLTKNLSISYGTNIESLPAQVAELNLGASTSMPTVGSQQDRYANLAILSVSPQNTGYSSFDNCDIIYNKALTTLVWLAPKTTRGLTLPDQLPQSQITALGTKLSANIMQGYPLYIGTQITDLTNLYLGNKSFTTVAVGAGNTAFSVENGMLRTATNLIKAGTSNTGDLIIPNVQTIEANCFLRCTGYTGNLTIPNTVTSVVANNFNGLSGLTGSLVIGSGLTTIPANAFAGLIGLTGNLTIPNTVTSIASGVFRGLTNLTTLTLPVGYDCAIYSIFTFANFSAASLNAAILNLANGTVGTPKYFFISKTSLDALNVAYPNAVSDAAARYINVSNIITEGLKLWLDAGNTLSYPGSGTVWNDLSGNGNNGTLVNGVAYSTANGGVMSFDGVNDYVNLGLNFDYERTQPFTMGEWIYCKSNGTFVSLIGNQASTPYSGRGFYGGIEYQTSNRVAFILRNLSGGQRIYVATTTAVTLNAWNYIMITYDGSSDANGVNFYINGISQPKTIIQNDLASTTKSGIATTLGGRPFTGSGDGWQNDRVNDATIYNRTLSAFEVLQNFNVTRNKYGI